MRRVLAGYLQEMFSPHLLPIRRCDEDIVNDGDVRGVGGGYGELAPGPEAGHLTAGDLPLLYTRDHVSPATCPGRGAAGVDPARGAATRVAAVLGRHGSRCNQSNYIVCVCLGDEKIRLLCSFPFL